MQANELFDRPNTILLDGGMGTMLQAAGLKLGARPEELNITDPALKATLADLCDHQPMIAKAPWALIFVVDYAKWIDLFEHVGCFEPEFVERTGKAPRRAPGLGDFAIAAQDAVIAAQNAVVAAEALGLGSCYIGDIVENAEEVAELLDLPPYTMPGIIP